MPGKAFESNTDAPELIKCKVVVVSGSVKEIFGMDVSGKAEREPDKIYGFMRQTPIP